MGCLTAMPGATIDDRAVLFPLMSPVTDHYAVIGHPVAHSRSPEIHAAFAQQTGQAISYTRLECAPDAFAATARRFFDDGGVGLNVTLPFKQEAAQWCDVLSERATLAGAVNTLKRLEDGRILGDNTDGAGLVADLTRHLDIDLAGQRIVILGAGGAVRGVVPILLAEQPATVVIANRTRAKAQAIVEACGDSRLAACALDDAPHNATLLINAISAGLHGEMPSLPDALVSQATAAYDMIYADHPTPFLAWAGQHGITRQSDGFGMLVEQAAESFTLWRGCRPETASVISALRPRPSAL